MRFPLALLSFCVFLAADTLHAAELDIDRSAGPARIQVTGQTGKDYLIEGTTNLASPAWEFLLNMPLTNSPQGWYDAESVLLPQRFYRATEYDATPMVAQDFRLIDQMGRSRRLYYYTGATNVKAVVLIFTGNGSQRTREMLASIKALTNYFIPRGVLFWMVDANQQDNRSNILVEASSLGLSNGPPILYDPSQAVARSYRATRTTEAICGSTSDWGVFFRGAIDDRLGSNSVATTQYYLSNALVKFLAGNTVSPNQTAVRGDPVTYRPRWTNLSYSADIAPILIAKCVNCHSEGNIAPFALTNHEIVQLASVAIRHETLSGHMPPWHADPQFGVWTNDLSLSPDQLSKLIQWIDDGAPRGQGPDPLESNQPGVQYPFAWPDDLGQPDVIYRIPLQSIKATGIEAYRYIDVTNTIPSNVWLRAAVVRPTNVKVVHHSLVFDGSTVGGGLDGFFAGYVPGQGAPGFPTGTGKFLKTNQVLQFQMHYTTIGTPETDRTEIGLYLYRATPQYPLQTKSAFNVSFNIPANAPDHQDSAQFPQSGTLATNILMFELAPHMHLRGSRFKYEAVYPNGTREVLLNIPNYEFHWQTMYRFTQPKYIPKGSRIICTGAWDNTILNRHLSAEYYASGEDIRYLPNRNVRFGEQSYDEMFIGYINYAEVP